jgi:hypothetical protein
LGAVGFILPSCLSIDDIHADWLMDSFLG